MYSVVDSELPSADDSHTASEKRRMAKYTQRKTRVWRSGGSSTDSTIAYKSIAL